jgi:endonuclease/exonuclease/phosphatase family metal-dependent hydrolase
MTYPPLNVRYDWILISDELEFKSYQVIMNRISDHPAVVSEIVLRLTTDTF